MKQAKNMDKSKYTIEKSQCEVYILRRREGSEYWADITVHCNNNAGRIQIASDYGSWQNYWGHCACPFKEFLIKLSRDMDYAATKFRAKGDDDNATPQFKMFWNEVWPEFINELKKENKISQHKILIT
jgi:hypothetical protein